ncbi:cDNA sequence AK129302 [Mus musculus]|nr:cDNA sequence AK129302 [Mus musculus]
MKRRWRDRPLLVVKPLFGQSDRCSDFFLISLPYPY